MTTRRPPIGNQFDAFKARAITQLPVIEHAVHDRIEFFLRRVPWLDEVVVHIGRVDGCDRSLRVGVGRKKRPLCSGESLASIGQELHAVHHGHALIRKDERYRVAALLELIQHFNTGCTGIGAHNAILFAILFAQITRDGS